MSSPGARVELPPLRGAALVVTAIALALGTFMQVLDTTIANVSLPTIAGNLGVSADQGTWIITSFAVANGIGVPLTGWLMGRYGVVRVFVLSVLMFTVASFLCGIAWSLTSIVAFRVLQGAVSGPMIPGSQALLISIFPPQRRAAAMGIWSMTTLVAPIAGPLLGGYLCDNFSWNWIFLINVPVGIICAVLCWRFLAPRESQTRKLPIDAVGLGLLVVWVGSLQVMLDQGKDADWFASSQIVILALVAAALFVVWLIWELTDKHPIVDLTLFRDRNFALGTIVLCLGYAVFFANILLLPLWLQTQLGYTATWAGLVAAPSGIVAVAATFLSARVMTRLDARTTATVSFIAFTVSYFLRANFTTDVNFASIVIPLLVQGIGMGTFFISMLSIAIGGVAPQRIPAATGITNFARITSGSFAASITTTMWDRREALHQSRLVESSTPFNPALQHATVSLHALGLTDAQGYGVLLRNVVSQAYLMASDDLFWISAWLSLAMIPLIWLARRTVSQTGAPVGGD